MNPASLPESTRDPLHAASWSAVLAMSFCVATLIASEFMPLSLLTPIAADLAVSEGRAGQAIAVSGLFAVIASLSIGGVTRGMDRRRVLLGLTLLMVISGGMTTFASGALTFMAGRALLGIVIGGFWSMSAATAMRLVPEADVPRALGLLNGGNAIATMVAAPLGSLLGEYVGWRGAFFAVMPLAAATFGWLYLTLPSLPAVGRPGGNVFRVLARRNVTLGMGAVGLFFMGQFVLQTFLRPFLEVVSGVDGPLLSLILLGMGIAGLIGTYAIGFVLGRRFNGVLVTLPLLMAALAVALIFLGSSPVASASLLAGWGLVATAAPVAWWSWISKALPDDAEAGGGLFVAIVQLAIALGASAGGALLDFQGFAAIFGLSALILTGCAGMAAILARRDRRLAQANRSSTDDLSTCPVRCAP